MKAKRIVEAVMYALEEMRDGPIARTYGLGIHARFGLIFKKPR